MSEISDDKRDSLEEPKETFYNIFINNVDSFNGKYILSGVYKQGFEVPLQENVLTEESIATEEGFEEIQEETRELNIEICSEKHSNASLTIDKLFNPQYRGQVDVSKYKIYGTLADSKSKFPEEKCQIIHEDQENFKSILFSCNCIIYDISLDSSQISKALITLTALEQEIERQKGAASEESPESTIFILISSAMTWALTTKLDNNDADPLAFNESDYRRRKPHPNYKEHYDCEREVQKKGKRFKDILCTYVVCSGVTYGYEEDILSFLFLKAWGNVEYLPIFGNGQNFIPLIHVADLAQIICKIIKTTELRCKYIIAVEQTPSTLKNIVKYISRSFGSGKIQYLAEEEAFLHPEIDRRVYDNITSNIVMEPKYLNEILEFNWKTDMNFVENIDEIVEEYRTEKKLFPMKILMHGPPCIGKTTLAKLLCNHYKLRYVNLKNILDSHQFPPTKNMDSFDIFESEFSSELFSRNKSKKHLVIEDFIELFDVMEDDSEDETYQKTIIEAHKKMIPKEYTDNPNYRLTDEQVVELIRIELMKNHSQNQGFVLDGFPKTIEQVRFLVDELIAEELFRYENSDETTGHGEIPPKDVKLIPNYIIFLDASNDYLLDLMSKAPEEAIKDSHYNERDLVKRLLIYREHNKTADGFFEYFKDCDTEIIEIDVMQFESDTFTIFKVCVRIFGAPNDFWMPPEQEIVDVRENYWNALQETKAAEKRVKINRKLLDNKIELLLEKYNRENVMEQRKLATKIDKYRIFMAEKIVPFLCEAIMTVVMRRPENPVDFLAEYLFTYNSNGKMYNPRYTRDGEHLIEAQIQKRSSQ